MSMPEEMRRKLPVGRREKDAATKATEPRARYMTGAILRRIDDMEQTPHSGIAMCHAQGKTAIYVSDDGNYLIHHPPHGPIKRTLRAPAPRGQ